MTTFDIIVASLLTLSFMYSVYKGMVREIFSFLAYLCGFYTAMRFQSDGAAYAGHVIANATAARIIAYILIFLATVILVSFIGKGIRSLMKSSGGLTGLDRLVGGLIGLLKGAFLIIVLLMPLEIFPTYYRAFTKDSRAEPYLHKASMEIRKFLGYPSSFADKGPKISVTFDSIKGDAKEKMKVLDELEKLAAKKIKPGNKAPAKEKTAEKAKENEAKPAPAADGNGEPQDSYTEEDKSELKKIFKSFTKE